MRPEYSGLIEDKIVCPYAARACNPACRAHIPEGDRCGVLEWMRLTGSHTEQILRILEQGASRERP